jgi:hypothetical protein
MGNLALCNVEHKITIGELFFFLETDFFPTANKNYIDCEVLTAAYYLLECEAV